MGNAGAIAPRSALLARAGGPLLTLALAAVIEGLSDTPLGIPNPPALLVLAVVFSAFRGGIAAGLASAAIACGYIGYFFSQPGHPLRYTDENLRRVVVWALVMPVLALLVGWLNRRAARAVAAAKAAGLCQELLEERQRADAALKISERRFRALVDHTSDAIEVIDPETGRYLDVNEKACLAHGYTREEYLALAVADVDPTVAARNWRAVVEELRRAGSTVTAGRHRRKDGSTFPVEVSASYISLDRDYILAVARDVAERARAEQEREDHLRFLESMDRVNRALHGTNDLEQMMRDLLDAVLEIFGCDRAWLAYPCDPAAASWRVPMERTRPEFPGALALGIDIPMEPEAAELFQVVRSATGPVRSGPGGDRALPTAMVERFQVQSRIAMAVDPRVDRPYVFGLHQCSYPRQWTPQEARLFDEIGRRLADVLTGLLVHRNLREAHQRAEARVAELAATFSSMASGIVLYGPDGTVLRANQAAERMFARAGVPSALPIAERAHLFRPVQEDGRPVAALDDLPPQRALRGETVQDCVLGLADAETQEISWLAMNAAPVQDADGRMLGAVLTFTDITERRRAGQALRRRLAESEAVSRISAALRTAQTLDGMLPILLDETLAALDSDAGVIWLQGRQDGDLRVAVARGWFEELEEQPVKPGQGMAGTVFASGRSHTSREFLSDPLTRLPGPQTVPAGWGGIGVPLRSASEVVGVLFVAVQLPREINPEEAKLLASLAAIAGTALHRLRLHEETVRRLERLQALQTVLQAIAGSLDLRVTLDVLLEQVRSRLGVDAAGVLLLAPQSLELKYAAGRGFRSQAYMRSSARLGEGLVGRAARERKLVRAQRVLEAPAFLRADLLRDEGFLDYVAMPFIAKGQVKGVLEVFHRTPLRPDVDWLSFLETLAQQTAIAIENSQMFDGLQRSNADLSLAYDSTIEGWSRALDLRDKETEGHTLRVAEMTVKLARAAGMTPPELVHVRRGALLHDIGKMGIPDAILLKPGPLSDDEWGIMHRHPTYAYDLLSPIAHLRPALAIPYCHHERWDGSGYPRGLEGEQIPREARLFAVVDVWDALRSDRPYRPAWPEERVVELLHAQAGRHFEPRAVALFFQVRA